MNVRCREGDLYHVAHWVVEIGIGEQLRSVEATVRAKGTTIDQPEASRPRRGDGQYLIEVVRIPIARIDPIDDGRRAERQAVSQCQCADGSPKVACKNKTPQTLSSHGTPV